MADEVKTDTAQANPDAVKDGSPAPKDSAPPAGGTSPPEKYELKLPEGSLLAPSSIEEVSAYAKAKGLSNEAAQEVLKNRDESVKAFHEAQMKEVEDIRASWRKESETDKEIGGENFKANAETAFRVIEKFGSASFKEMLKETGFGDHPEVVRLFVRIGKVLADDKFVPPGGAKLADVSDPAYRMYGTPEKTK